MKAQILVELAKDSAAEWKEDNAPLLAAALAFYTLFSVAPLLIIVTAIAGLIFGEAAVQQDVYDQIRDVVGANAADSIYQIIEQSSKPSGNIIAMLIGIATMLLGASWVFAQMKQALNAIWDIEPKPAQGGMLRGILGAVWARLFPAVLVLAIGMLLILTVVINMVLSSLHLFVGDLVPGMVFFWQVVNFVVSWGIVTVLFALIFKVLPDAHINWGDVWIGAAVTGLLFSLGRLLISLYLGYSSVGSSYGAAGSLVVVLMWVYYSAQIFLFGAEFTHVYTQRYGSQIVSPAGAGAEQETSSTHE